MFDYLNQLWKYRTTKQLQCT